MLYQSAGFVSSQQAVNLFIQVNQHEAIVIERDSGQGPTAVVKRLYLVDLRDSGSEAHRRAFASYLCERWNRAHEDDLERLTVSYVEQPTRLDGAEPTRRVELLQHECQG